LPRPEEKLSNNKGAPTLQGLAAILARCGIELDPAQLGRLWQYHQLLRERNPELNLTRIHNFQNMVIKLYVDSILPGTMISLPSPLMDLGSGPGMPGIPLKIAYPHVRIQLAESRQARNRFLREACDLLQMEGLQVIGAGISPKYEGPVAGVITRAVEPIARTLDRITGCLAAHGLAIFMKGPNCDDEVKEALDLHHGRFALDLDRAYRIPSTSHMRRLIAFRRLTQPPASIRSAAEKRHPVRDIESEQNSLFKELRKLLTGRGVKKEGRTLVAGSRQVSELLRDFPRLCAAWISRLADAPPPSSASGSLQWYRLAPALFDQLDQFGTHEPLLLMRVPEIPAWDPDEEMPAGCTLLIPFQNPENVGTVIRSAAAFGVSQVILLKEAAHPFHPKALRASGGAVFRVALKSGPSISDLSESLSIVALSCEGRPLQEDDFHGSFGLLPGIEGPGLTDRWRERAVAIPIAAGVESLNAATAVAIALYAWRAKTGFNGEDMRK
jgi:16S rRNA (guanine(527)-N(7))-methyltransferase RsmG